MNGAGYAVCCKNTMLANLTSKWPDFGQILAEIVYLDRLNPLNLPGLTALRCVSGRGMLFAVKYYACKFDVKMARTSVKF